MHYFSVTRNRLCCEDVSVEQLARRFGTPLYLYSQQTITRHFQALEAALAPLPHQICYSVKANSNAAILRLLRNLGSSFDIVSAGELARVRAAGGDPADCMFAGVAKTEEEIELALRLGVYAFNVESRPELARIDKVARRLNLVAPISVRVNPDVPARTHAKITTGTYQNKFGIAYEEVPAVYAEAARLKHLRLRGIQMHIGSQLTSTEPFAAAARKVAPLVERLARQYELEFFSIGGGLGIVYDPALKSGAPQWWRSPSGRKFITPASYARAVVPILEPLRLRILIEPGRFLVGNAAILVTRVEYVKNTGKKTFVIVDAGMNDLIRPSLYEAYHEIVPVTARPSARAVLTDVVGPICESGDYFCQDRMLPAVKAGDYLAIMSAGAYGFVMASNYNSRPLPAEVLVNGEELSCIRKRQSLDDLSRDEIIPPWL